MPNPSKIALLAELPGLEAARDAITARIAEIRRLVYGEEPTEQRQIRRRNISEEVRQQRRQFLAKARAAKLERLAEKKASIGSDARETILLPTLPKQRTSGAVAATSADITVKSTRKRK